MLPLKTTILLRKPLMTLLYIDQPVEDVELLILSAASLAADAVAAVGFVFAHFTILRF